MSEAAAAVVVVQLRVLIATCQIGTQIGVRLQLVQRAAVAVPVDAVVDVGAAETLVAAPSRSLSPSATLSQTQNLTFRR